MEVSPALVANVRQVWGREGDRWLAQLPTLIADLRRRWGLSEPVAYPELSYHYVARSSRGSMDVTLKIGCDREAVRRESMALAGLGGPIVPLLETSLDHGALLLEHVDPGVTLQSQWTPESDLVTTRILAETMRGVRRPCPKQGFPTVSQWLESIPRFRPPFAAEATRLQERLSSADSRPWLLHGDLHHGNLLRSGDQWTVIDPKGVVGPAGFEIYSLLQNPIRVSPGTLVDLLPGRLEVLSLVLELPVHELAAWGFLGVSMSMAWEIEDESEPTEGSIRVAKSLMAWF